MNIAWQALDELKAIPNASDATKRLVIDDAIKKGAVAYRRRVQKLLASLKRQLDPQLSTAYVLRVVRVHLKNVKLKD